MDHQSPIRAVWSAFACFALVAGAAVLLAAEQQPTNPARSFTPVDPGIVDLSTNALSRRILPIDQRIPTGFEQVFKINPAAVPSALGGKPMFARKSGALTAIFPRARYNSTESGGLEPIIPPDTRFMIGEQEFALAAPAPAPSHAAVSRRADSSARRAPAQSARRVYSPNEATAAPPISEPRVAGMLTDDSYRVRRVAELLSRAAAADPHLDE